MSVDRGLLCVGASVFGAPVEGGEGRGAPGGKLKFSTTPLVGGRSILRVRDNAVELSWRWLMM